MRADGPTASKEALKIALMISANEKFNVKAGDIKSAFLQGEKMQREFFVRPPKEAKADGILWRLVQGAYGILDGGRLFYLRLLKELKKLGMHQIHSESALFSYVKDGKLRGLVVTNTDDLILAGDSVFDKDITEKLQDIFKFSKIESNNFNYCGSQITVNEDGSITLDQNKYTKSLKEVSEINSNEDRSLTEKEKRILRGKVGELLWLSLISRPDLSFDVNAVSSKIVMGNTSLVNVINTLVKRARASDSMLRFTRLGELSDLSVKVYADASFCNSEDKMRSTEGRVILLTNEKSGHVNVCSWKTKKISRVCRSVKAAETRSLEEALDDAINTARMVREIYSGSINLKAPEQLPVKAYTDSKTLWESLHNSRQCEEKILRCSIASMKELSELGMVSEVQWVPTAYQLADCLTKSGKKADWLLKVSLKNRLDF